MSQMRRPVHERTMGDATTCRHAVWDYLVWGDVAYTFFEWVARKFLPMFVKGKVGLLFEIMTIGHLFYIVYAMRMVYMYKFHATKPKLSRLVPVGLLCYGIICVAFYMATKMFSPVSYATLQFLHFGMGLLHK